MESRKASFLQILIVIVVIASVVAIAYISVDLHTDKLSDVMIVAEVAENGVVAIKPINDMIEMVVLTNNAKNLKPGDFINGYGDLVVDSRISKSIMDRIVTKNTTNPKTTPSASN